MQAPDPTSALESLAIADVNRALRERGVVDADPEKVKALARALLAQANDDASARAAVERSAFADLLPRLARPNRLARRAAKSRRRHA